MVILHSMRNRFSPTKWEKLLLPVGLFLIIIGGKYMLIRSHGSDVPHWDQWDIEGVQLIKPWLENTLSPGDLFTPHNEHRPFFTRIWALGLFILNGQWDARLEMVANTFLHIGSAVLLLSFLNPLFRGWQKTAFAALLGLLFALPFNWEGTVHGFQSQFYFLLLFTLVHLHGSLTRRPLGPGWWGAQAAGLATLFCMGSGAVSALVIMALLSFKGLVLRQGRRADIATAVVSAIIVVAGILLWVSAAWHDHLRPDSILTYFHSLFVLLSWPFPFFLVAPLMIAPIVLFALKARSTEFDSGTVLFVIGLGAWTWIQAAALAYSRGGFQLGYSSRYSDVLVVAVVASAAALAALMQSRMDGVKTSRTAILAACWTTLVVSGLLYRSFWGERSHLNDLRRIHPIQISHIRKYIATGEVSALSNKPVLHIPYPDANRLSEFLSDPTIRSILPVSIRPPIQLVTDRFSTHGIVPNGIPPETRAKPIDTPQGSYTDQGVLQEGYFRSEPIDPDLPMINLTIAGTFSLDQEHLTFIGFESADIVEPMIKRLPGGRFRNLNSFRPKGPFVISVADRSPDTWIAISNPIEIGFTSWLAKEMTKLGFVLLVAGLGLTAIGTRSDLRQLFTLTRSKSNATIADRPN
jgi:hypothetical protein